MPPNQLPAKAQALLGLPDGFKTVSPFPFEGMNVQSSAMALKDTEFTWLENFARIGDGALRTMWDVGPAIYVGSIEYYSFYTIGINYYCAIVHSDGSATQLNTTTTAQTSITPSLPFYTSSGLLPCLKQWGTQYLLISNRNTDNDYWVWDGSLLYEAGTVAPNSATILSGGFDYTGAPSYTVFGGFGSGVTLSLAVSGGQLVEATITNPGSGYQPGDVVQVAFSGGGADTTPILTANLNPGTVGGATITAAGTGYTSAPTVAFSGGGGTGAAATAVISGGVTAVSVGSPGTGYTTAPAVLFSGGGGTGAAAFAIISGSGVASVTVTAPGTGYTSAPSVIFSGVGTGAAATATEVNTVTAITITSPGSGYTTAPTIAISGGGGSGATATAVLAPNGVASVTVVNGGTGFTTVPLITLEGGGGAGATAFVELTGTSVAAINLTSGGQNYTQVPDVHINGGFLTGTSGVQATAVAIMAGETVGRIEITNAGSGYNSSATVLILAAVGDTGTGAGAVVLFAPTSISSVVVSSTGQYYTSAPAVVAGPGANGAAYASLSLMPYGVSGSAMETYLSRVWIVNPAQQQFTTLPPGGDWQVSAPGSLTDFATSDGGVQAVNADSFLQVQYTNVHQSSGYLYFFGDGSVSVVSNVSTAQASGSTVVSTQYNYQNVDPQSGTPWRDTLQDFGRSSIVTNSTGVYGLYGGTLSKISGKLDQLFTPATQGGLFVPPSAGGITPTSAVATIFNIKHYLVLLTLLDPDTAVQRNVMVTWNEKDWTITSQSVSLISISTQKVGSSYFAFGSDGSSIYPLFAQPSTALAKRFDTKQYGADRSYIQKQALGIWLQAQDQSLTQSGVRGTLVSVASGIALQNGFAPSDSSEVWTSNFRLQPNFTSPPPFWGLWGTAMEGVAFITMGIRFTSNSPDFTLGNLVIGYKDVTAFYGQ